MTNSAGIGAGDDACLISITEAARLLSEAGDHIDRSALSRYCDLHDLKRGKRGRSVLVDLEEVRRHRATNYQREVMRGEAGQDLASIESGAGLSSPVSEAPASLGLDASDAKPVPVASNKRAVGRRPGAAGPGVVIDADPQRRKRNAEAERAEIDLAERKRNIVSVDEVEAGIADAISVMRQTFAATAGIYAAEAMPDLGLTAERRRALEAHFKRYARRGEEKYIETISRLGAETRADESATRRRLEVLSDHAARLIQADRDGAGVELSQ